jgi:COMPASS component BRE2
MAETQKSPARGNTPSALSTPLPGNAAPDHAPSIPSPLNPDAASMARNRTPKTAPSGREQREKKDSLKKRESAAAAVRGATPDIKSTKTKIKDEKAVPSPMRYTIPEPKYSDYEPAKGSALVSHEHTPFFTPDGETELKKPLD